MNQITYNSDMTADAYSVDTVGKQHHFHLPISQAAYATGPLGQDTKNALTTGLMTCVDGDGYTETVTFQLLGDGVSQQAHCMYRYATTSPAITLQQAAQSVITDVEGAGAVPRIDANGQPL